MSAWIQRSVVAVASMAPDLTPQVPVNGRMPLWRIAPLICFAPLRGFLLCNMPIKRNML